MSAWFLYSELLTFLFEYILCQALGTLDGVAFLTCTYFVSHRVYDLLLSR